MITFTLSVLKDQKGRKRKKFLKLSFVSSELDLEFKKIFFQGSVLNGFGYIFTILTFSILYNLIKFFEFETVYEETINPETNEV